MATCQKYTQLWGPHVHSFDGSVEAAILKWSHLMNNSQSVFFLLDIETSIDITTPFLKQFFHLASRTL